MPIKKIKVVKSGKHWRTMRNPLRSRTYFEALLKDELTLLSDILDRNKSSGFFHLSRANRVAVYCVDDFYFYNSKNKFAGIYTEPEEKILLFKFNIDNINTLESGWYMRDNFQLNFLRFHKGVHLIEAKTETNGEEIGTLKLTFLNPESKKVDSYKEFMKLKYKDYLGRN